MQEFFWLDSRGRFVVRDGRAVMESFAPPGATTVQVGASLWAARVSVSLIDAQLARHARLSGEVQIMDLRGIGVLDSPDASQLNRAAMLLRHREGFRYDPADGTPLDFADSGVAKTQNGAAVFPRIDPAVIGLVVLRGTDRILLGRNARRPQFYSIIAGYVEAGESLEQAMTREIEEETGRRVDELRYWGSQSWPLSGALMVGFIATTRDEHPVRDTDDELLDTVWVRVTDVADLSAVLGYPGPAPGSIARKMLYWWSTRYEEQEWSI